MSGFRYYMLVLYSKLEDILPGLVEFDGMEWEDREWEGCWKSEIQIESGRRNNNIPKNFKEYQRLPMRFSECQ